MQRRYPARRAAILIVMAALTVWACQSGERQPPDAVMPPATTSAPVEPLLNGPIAFTPPPPAYSGELPPLPFSPSQAARPPEVVRAVYTFAARHPEVLHYVPCFCGCQNAGHQDNDDCFIKGRDAAGRPTWEPHGMT